MENDIKWHTIHCGHIAQHEIHRAVEDYSWQQFREALRNKPLIERYARLVFWLGKYKNTRRAQVQVTNYINALTRAGMIHVDPSAFESRIRKVDPIGTSY